MTQLRKSHTNDIKIKSSKLRSLGLSYDEINRKLGTNVSKSTMAYWFSKFDFSESEMQLITRSNKTRSKISQIKAIRAIATKREATIKSLYDKYIKLITLKNIDPKLLLLSSLYICEGAKYESTSHISFSNSDPQMMLAFLNTIREIYKIDTKKLRMRIQIRHDQSAEDAERFWKLILNLMNVKTYPTYIDKRTKSSKTKNKEYHGVCTLIYFDSKLHIILEMISLKILTLVNKTEISDSMFIRHWL